MNNLVGSRNKLVMRVITNSITCKFKQKGSKIFLTFRGASEVSFSISLKSLFSSKKSQYLVQYVFCDVLSCNSQLFASFTMADSYAFNVGKEFSRSMSFRSFISGVLFINNFFFDWSRKSSSATGCWLCSKCLRCARKIVWGFGCCCFTSDFSRNSLSIGGGSDVGSGGGWSMESTLDALEEFIVVNCCDQWSCINQLTNW